MIYNTNLIDITNPENEELTLAFVDDTTYIVIGPTFKDIHKTLKDMVEDPMVCSNSQEIMISNLKLTNPLSSTVPTARQEQDLLWLSRTQSSNQLSTIIF